MDTNVLVSCSVITYNSASTVLETLDSIKEQTYPTIELIVSDDCSNDNTVKICQEWISKNKERFVRVQMITIDYNTGLSANANRALEACQGVWHKTIAGDDMLLPSCVEDFMNFVDKHPEMKWISSRARKYYETFEEKNCFARNFAPDPSFFKLDAEGQLKALIQCNILIAPTMFYMLSFEKSIGYDTKYFFEDLPFYLTAYEKGEKCYFLDKETVCYRVHQSISSSTTKLFNYDSLQGYRKFRKERMLKYMNARQIRGQRLIWSLQDFFENHQLNKNNKVTSFFYNHLILIINKIYF